MSKLYIFGDSYSTNYNYNDGEHLKNNDYAIKYYNKEKEKGYIGKFKDLPFFLSKLLNVDEIVNTAIPGCSNSTILDNFLKYINDFQEGDYISFQTSFISRDYKYDIYDIKINYTKLEKSYLKNIINMIKLVRKVCILTKVNFYIWTIDDKLVSESTIKKNLYNKYRIKDKFKDLKDLHLNFEGYEIVANSIINNWETHDNYIKNDKKLI